MMIMPHCCVWIQIVCSWRWRYSFRISGSVFLSLYHFDYFGHTYRHALQNLRFKELVSWKWWSCLMLCFVWIPIVVIWLWRCSFSIPGSVFWSLYHFDLLIITSFCMAHRHALQIHLFKKKNVSWKSWSYLMFLFWLNSNSMCWTLAL